MPTPGKPTVCTSVAMPQANRSALIRIATSCGDRPERAADDQRHGDRTGVHDQHVLQPEREQLGYRQHLVDGMDGWFIVLPCLGG